MRNTIVAGALVLVTLMAAAYFTSELKTPPDATSRPAADDSSTDAAESKSGALPYSTPSAETIAEHVAIGAESAPADLRLANLSVSPDNGLIEFVVGSEGKVIAEIDKDPTSLGFKKPLREYTYAGDNVIGLTSYRYFADHVQITRTAVSYKPDGGVDDYRESTSYDYERNVTGPG